MLRLMVLTFPFLVMAALFYGGYMASGSTFPGVMSILCLLVDVVILFRYNAFLRRSKKSKDQDQSETVSEEE